MLSPAQAIQRPMQCTLVLLGMLLCLTGCGGSSDSAEDFPAPGTMEILSSTALDTPTSRENLLENGEFQLWWAGAPNPEVFYPPSRTLSHIDRIWSSAGFVARQHWTVSEKQGGFADHFRSGSAKLKQDQAYRLTVAASDCVGQPIGLSLWQKRNNRWQLAHKDILVIPPLLMGAQVLSADFTPTATADYLVVAKPIHPSTIDHRIDWHSWRLEAL